MNVFDALSRNSLKNSPKDEKYIQEYAAIKSRQINELPFNIFDMINNKFPNQTQLKQIIIIFILFSLLNLFFLQIPISMLFFFLYFSILIGCMLIEISKPQKEFLNDFLEIFLEFMEKLLEHQYHDY
jgi:hypothetical protein